jgi:hypothetical protein
MGGLVPKGFENYEEYEAYREEQAFHRAMQKLGHLPHSDKRIKPIKEYGSGHDMSIHGEGKPYGKK